MICEFECPSSIFRPSYKSVTKNLSHITPDNFCEGLPCCSGLKDIHCWIWQKAFGISGLKNALQFRTLFNRFVNSIRVPKMSLLLTDARLVYTILTLISMMSLSNG